MPREQLPLTPPENNRPVVRRITREQMAQRINENDIRFRGRIPRFSFSAKDNSKEASIKERLIINRQGFEVIADIMKNRIAYYHQRLV